MLVYLFIIQSSGNMEGREKKESEVIGRGKQKEGYVESPTEVYSFCNLSMNYFLGI